MVVSHDEHQAGQIALDSAPEFELGQRESGGIAMRTVGSLAITRTDQPDVHISSVNLVERSLDEIGVGESAIELLRDRRDQKAVHRLDYSPAMFYEVLERARQHRINAPLVPHAPILAQRARLARNLHW